jgi:choline kinase
MKAVILAAGIASRLRPLTNNTPKCLLKVGTESILEITIRNILANNIDDIIIITGYLEEQIRRFVDRNFPQVNVKFIYNKSYSTTNNIYSLWLAKDALYGDDMLLMDSDIIFDGNILTKLLASTFENCLALKRHNVLDEEIKVKTDGNDRILEISKEVRPSTAAGESVGIEIFRGELLTELFEIIDRKVNKDKLVNQFYEAAFQELINNDRKIYVVDITEYFCMEIDTAEDLESAGMQYKPVKSNKNKLL